MQNFGEIFSQEPFEDRDREALIMEVEAQEVTTITQVGVLNIFWWSLILIFVKGQGLNNDVFQLDQDSEVVEGDTEVQRQNGMLYLLLNSFPV